jgi:hypothetical protein
LRLIPVLTHVQSSVPAALLLSEMSMPIQHPLSATHGSFLPPALYFPFHFSLFVPYVFVRVSCCPCSMSCPRATETGIRYTTLSHAARDHTPCHLQSAFYQLSAAPRCFNFFYSYSATLHRHSHCTVLFCSALSLKVMTYVLSYPHQTNK